MLSSRTGAREPGGASCADRIRIHGCTAVAMSAWISATLSARL